MQDEAQVISQVRAGNTDAFTDIVECYQGSIIRYLHRLTGEYEVALDLAQDTFVRAYQGILKTDAELSLKPWLPLVLTAKEAAKFLRIGKSTFYEQVRCGRIPHLTIGRRILVPRDSLLKMLEEEATKELKARSPI